VVHLFSPRQGGVLGNEVLPSGCSAQFMIVVVHSHLLTTTGREPWAGRPGTAAGGLFGMREPAQGEYEQARTANHLNGVPLTSVPQRDSPHAAPSRFGPNPRPVVIGCSSFHSSGRKSYVAVPSIAPASAPTVRSDVQGFPQESAASRRKLA
jgi:hypothetical protein